MIDLYLFLDLVVVIGLAVLALTVFVKNASDLLHQLFTGFVFCIDVWIIANYISNDISNSPRVATIANYFVFSFSYAATIFLLAFIVRLVNNARLKRLMKWSLIPLVLITIISATPLVVQGVELQGSLYAVVFGPASPIYFLSLIINIILAFIVAHYGRKHVKGNDRQRLSNLLKSMYLTFPILVLAQAVIPATTGWFGLTNIGVLPMLILVFGLYYNVVRYKLFDLRFIVVRAIAYVATIATIAVAYGAITHYLTTYIESQFNNRLLGDFVNIAFIVLAVLSYGFLKKRFDRITNRLFYQDAYDAQTLLNDLNRQLVSSIDLMTILRESSLLIEHYLKSSYVTFIIYDKHEGVGQHFSTQDQKLDEVKDIAVMARHSQKAILSASDTDSLTTEISEALSAHNIGIVVQLVSQGEQSNHLGSLVLGLKRSGNLYNRQDHSVIQIIADELVIAIQNALRFEEIQQFNITLQEKVDDATKQLRAANQKLIAMDQTKDDFISMASHQLRTPLTSVKGYLSMVLEGDVGKVSEKQKKLLDQSFLSAQRMVYLIADLLNVSRLKTGKFIIEPRPTNLAEVITGELAQLEETAAARDLTMTYEKPKDFPTLELDETKIRQVIMNFADNAIYYTPSGGHIKVSLEDKGDTVEFTVTDDGIGVPKEEQHNLFTKFYRANNAKKARPDGTGLGLFMAKKVIAAQGGEIIFKTEEGKGSTFGFSLDKSKLAAAAGSHTGKKSEQDLDQPQI